MYKRTKYMKLDNPPKFEGKILKQEKVCFSLFLLFIISGVWVVSLVLFVLCLNSNYNGVMIGILETFLFGAMFFLFKDFWRV